MHVENVGEYLKGNGIKPSIQRMKIFQYLLDHHTHPTVDDIFKNLSSEMPTLSKTTVYNTLNIFVKNHIVQEIVIEENEVRYDVVTQSHGHFKCKSCGAILDFDADLSKFDLSSLGDVEVEEMHFYLKGICSKCLKNKN
ncbi:Fur family transcriptional regulator [Leptotrichia sp. oral taxon 847]|uniref:Fur family transcriptional regulator n=1 Tax=Leptotrichia sp. oral taxon 847 TaxID=1785996 RepID=UPI0007684C7E|nr:Fur family transcriptional regulator [Leptotrichia sp. oral taxon 847]AMD95376.1 Fur family transcriptional regulator [Leptotrichia sp. oral taxon 847]